MATSDALTAERILEATEEVLRRYGPAKATVVDVARALGVSHGTVYRHFATKAALREAVTERWLARALVSLDAIASGPEEPEAKLRHWVRELFAAKRRKVAGDPELFSTYTVLVGESSAVEDRHLAHLGDQMARIVAEGVERGHFTAAAPVADLAHAVLDATIRFHHPVFASDWQRPDADARLEAVLDLVVQGLRARG
jgi:AcrR family transcriptional regulator